MKIQYTFLVLFLVLFAITTAIFIVNKSNTTLTLTQSRGKLLAEIPIKEIITSSRAENKEGINLPEEKIEEEPESPKVGDTRPIQGDSVIESMESAPSEVLTLPKNPYPLTPSNEISKDGESESLEDNEEAEVISNESISLEMLDHVVISEVQITGGAGKTTEDFIELYNPTNSDQDISRWKLKRRTKSGKEYSVKTIGDGSIIRARSFALWANSKNGFSDRVGAGHSSGATLAANNSIVLLSSEGLVIDAVAWGDGLTDPFSEGVPLEAKLEGNQSFERKAYTETCLNPQNVGELLGNGCDTDHNQNDFIVRLVSDPQNSNSAPEPH